MNYDYDVYDILETLSKYATYGKIAQGKKTMTGYRFFSVQWKSNNANNGAYARGMEEIYDICFYKNYSVLCIPNDIPADIYNNLPKNK